MKHEYAGGVLPHERPVIERFESDVLPYLEKHGPALGERAMQGDADCEQVIQRYRQFTEGDPAYRGTCLKHLISALQRAERNHREKAE